MAGFVNFGRGIYQATRGIDEGREEGQKQQLNDTNIEYNKLSNELLKQQLQMGGIDPKAYLKLYLENFQKQQLASTQAAGLRQQGDDYWNAGDKDTARRYYQMAEMVEHQIGVSPAGSASGVIKDQFGEFLRHFTQEGQINQQQTKAYNDWVNAKINQSLGGPDPGPPPSFAPMPNIGGAPAAPMYGYGGTPPPDPSMGGPAVNPSGSPTGHYPSNLGAPLATPSMGGVMPGVPMGAYAPGGSLASSAPSMPSGITVMPSAGAPPSGAGAPAVSRSFPGYFNPIPDPPWLPRGFKGNKLPYYDIETVKGLTGSPSPQMRQAASKELAWRQKNLMPNPKQQDFMDRMTGAQASASALIKAAHDLGKINMFEFRKNATKFLLGGWNMELNQPKHPELIDEKYRSYFTLLGQTYWNLWNAGKGSGNSGGGLGLLNKLTIHFPHGADNWFPDSPTQVAEKVRTTLLDKNTSALIAERDGMLRRKWIAEHGQGSKYMSPEAEEIYNNMRRDMGVGR